MGHVAAHMTASASHEGPRAKRLKRDPVTDEISAAPVTPTAGAAKEILAQRPVAVVTPSNTDANSTTADGDIPLISGSSALASMGPSMPTKRKPPDGWQDIYSLVEELRQDRTAPCVSLYSVSWLGTRLPLTQHRPFLPLLPSRTTPVARRLQPPPTTRRHIVSRRY